ncbi:PilN domain-containing protein [Thiolapillus sp.]
MANINLLPWRENLRKKRKRDFGFQLLFAILLAALATFFWYLQVQKQIEFQESRNAFLKAEIAKVDEKIKEIKDLEKKRAELVARMNVIQELQASRPMVVHLFDELVTTIPDGVFLESMSQKGLEVTLSGQAQSNARVSAYMRAIDASDWMKDPDLKVIKSKDKTDTGMSEFELVAKQANPNAKEEAEK